MIDTDKMREQWRHVEPSALLEMAQGDIFDLCDEVERLRAERQWRPIESDPPPIDERVLIRFGSGHVEDATFHDIDGELTHCLFDGEMLYDAPDYWMPLPEAPSDE